MADFDNGLPPAGTTSDAKASSVSYGKVDVKADKSLQAESVTLDKTDYKEIEARQIKAVTLDKTATGLNYGTFL
ncbi:hypothetical protein D0T84_15965 [Dysgonomonas sp. 521]|uniref:hypothetical protein n=1 Tax=Dysgonomonas sp. 521 TaxID=2302932 RepID=UPI0013D12FCD|nr:hypothetical protein [Dysgonomonas sp. 521]NDV96399.1 hypothetical protein [Dysgonomonas sp. 521]